MRESHEDNSSGGALPSGHVGSSSVNGQPKEFDDVTRSDTSKWDGDTEASKEKEVDVPQVNGINKSTTGESTARSEVDEEARPRGKLAGIFKLKGKDSEMSEEKKKRKAREPKFTVGNQLRATILGSWLNILLLAGKCSLSGIGNASAKNMKFRWVLLCIRQASTQLLYSW